MDKFKVIKEYEKYYLCEHEKHKYKECFSRIGHRLDKDGYITKTETDLGKIKQVPMPSELEKSYREFLR